MLFAVFEAFVAAQKHALLQHARILGGCIEGRSPLQALSELLD
jgi:hypothetical protein